MCAPLSDRAVTREREGVGAPRPRLRLGVSASSQKIRGEDGIMIRKAASCRALRQPPTCLCRSHRDTVCARVHRKAGLDLEDGREHRRSVGFRMRGNANGRCSYLATNRFWHGGFAGERMSLWSVSSIRSQCFSYPPFRYAVPTKRLPCSHPGSALPGHSAHSLQPDLSGRRHARF